MGVFDVSDFYSAAKNFKMEKKKDQLITKKKKMSAARDESMTPACASMNQSVGAGNTQ